MNINQYSYTDGELSENTPLYYKLITINEDGSIENEKHIKINNQSHIFEVQFSPNPFSGYTNMEINSNEERVYSMEIKNSLGKIVYKHENIISNSITEIGSTIEPGVYWTTISNDSSLSIQKIIKIE